MWIFENGQKNRSPVAVLLHCAVQDGASSSFDLSHVIKIELVSGLYDRPSGSVFFDVEGISLVEVRQQLVFWVLRYIKLITEKRSHASKLQNTFASVHDSNLVLRHQFLTDLLVVQPVGIVGGSGFRSVVEINRLLAKHFTQLFQSGFLLAAEEERRVTVADNGIGCILVDGLELRL